MKKTDITGVELPSVRLLGADVTMPDVRTYRKTYMLGGFLSACARAEVSADMYLQACESFAEFLSFNHQDKIFSAKDVEEAGVKALIRALGEYIPFLARAQSLERFKLPEIHTDGGYAYPLDFQWEKLAADYAGVSLFRVLSLNYIDYLILKREAFIHALSQSEKGRDMLEAAYCGEQTEPDRATLRAMFPSPEVRHG